jgi:hypothetical protein
MLRKLLNFRLLTVIVLAAISNTASAAEEGLAHVVDSLDNVLGMSLFEEEIDQVIFRTNEFLVSGGADTGGPFWYIMQFSMTLGALFAVIMAAGMAYKMMVKGEAFDPLKIFRVFGIAAVMFFWYGDRAGGTTGTGVLDLLAYVPNAVGSWTHDMYELEAMQVMTSYDKMKEPLDTINHRVLDKYAEWKSSTAQVEQLKPVVVNNSESIDNEQKGDKNVHVMEIMGDYAFTIVMIDKIVMLLSLVIFRVGWWGTIFVQQVLLGMLTIFGPLMWAFSILPKWEGAWAKWITRYLTVHFYGAMLYFVGFYVLLLFDIVVNMQYDMLQVIASSKESTLQYLSHAILTSGYLLVASIVSMKCLNLVPDLAAWMIPEGDTAFSTRNFGEGVASGFKQSVSSVGSQLSRN